MAGILDVGLGYRGALIIGGKVIPITSSNFDMDPSIIVDTGIHGSSNDNAASEIAFAEGTVAYAGNVSCALYQDLWTLLSDWTVNNRVTPVSALVSPDGMNWYTYGGLKVSTATFTCAEAGPPGSFVTLSLGLVGTSRVNASASSATFITTTCSNLNTAPVPYWKSRITGTFTDALCAPALTISTTGDPISWTINVTNNTVTTYVLNNSREPKYTTQGMLGVTGDFVLFNPTLGIPAPANNLISTDLKIEFLDNSASVWGTIAITKAVVEKFPMPFTGQNIKVVRTYNWRGLGDATKAAIALS